MAGNVSLVPVVQRAPQRYGQTNYTELQPPPNTANHLRQGKVLHQEQSALPAEPLLLFGNGLGSITARKMRAGARNTVVNI